MEQPPRTPARHNSRNLRADNMTSPSERRRRQPVAPEPHIAIEQLQRTPSRHDRQNPQADNMMSPSESQRRRPVAPEPPIPLPPPPVLHPQPNLNEDPFLAPAAANLNRNQHIATMATAEEQSRNTVADLRAQLQAISSGSNLGTAALRRRGPSQPNPTMHPPQAPAQPQHHPPPRPNVTAQPLPPPPPPPPSTQRGAPAHPFPQPPEAAPVAVQPLPRNRHGNIVDWTKVARLPMRDLLQPGVAEPHYLGRMDVACNSCGALHWCGEALKNSSKRNPKFGMCCKSGKVVLPNHQQPPDVLRDLLQRRGPSGRYFVENMRAINQAFAFVSIGVEIDRAITYGMGGTCFRISGELHHRIGALQPDEAMLAQRGRAREEEQEAARNNPRADPTENWRRYGNRFSQIYIHDGDTEEAARQRRHWANRAPVEQTQTFRDLAAMLHDCNPYVAVFQQAHRIMAAKPPHEHHNLTACLTFQEGTDPRRYNLPTVREVVAVIPDGVQTGPSKNLIVRYLDGRLLPIMDWNPMYLPLHYVLLFPRGEPGWHPEIPYRGEGAGAAQPDLNQAEEDGNAGDGPRNALAAPAPPELQMIQAEGADERDGQRKSVTRNEYYAYYLHYRLTHPDTLFRASRLFHQFAVDVFATTEQDRLKWIANNLSTIRADRYKGLMDALAVDANLDDIGQRVVLPSSFTNGTHYMYQLFQDSMAICRYHSHPDLFITFTANPNWKDIQDELLEGQTPADCPDLVDRVFQMKKEAFLHDLRVNGVMGKAVAHVHTIEFQKRGLPHMHCLLFLTPEHKICSVDDIDNMIRADIPDPVTETRLYNIVTRVMLHGPCNERCKDSTGKCSKGFPKPYREETTIVENGYPQLKRPHGGHTCVKGDYTYDSKDVVAFCAFLSLKYDAHINVEACISIKAVKYIHKYIYKGHDRTTMRLGSGDKVKQYLDARYVAAHEALWRLYQFRLHAEEPAVYRLPVHLEEEQSVTFDAEGGVTMRALERARNTQLTRFFDCNANNVAGSRTLLYQEFPEHFVWVDKDRRWKIRERDFAIGRMYAAHPQSGERFYLCLLLTKVRGPTSFEHLQTVNGEVCPDFKTACLRLGLLEDDSEWRQCLDEAKAVKTGHQLRLLFTVILLHCSPTEPRGLWDEFKISLCDDLERSIPRRFPHCPNPTEEDVYDYGLHLIDRILFASSKTLADFQLPLSVKNWEGREATGNRLVDQQQAYDVGRESELWETNERMLNDDQRRVLNAIKDAVEGGEGGVFFVQAAAGCGKTFVSNTLTHYFRKDSKIVLCVASSGIASLLLIGGRTVHSTFKVPIVIHEGSMCSIPKDSQLAEMLRLVDLILWDEAPMQQHLISDAVDCTLQDLRGNDKRFGGVVVAWFGDWRQTLPVKPKANRQQIMASCLTRSAFWESEVKVLRLTQNMRLTPEDVLYAKYLLELGEGQPQHTDPTGKITLPARFKCGNTIASLIQAIYPILEGPLQDDFFAERAILTSRNADVKEINESLLKDFPGVTRTYHSADSIVAEVAADQHLQTAYSPEVLASLNTSGLPLANLELKLGVPVMVLRNLDPANGVCNGSRGVVTFMSNRVVQIRLLTGDHKGEKVFIPRITTSSSPEDFPFTLQRRQFPLRLAFAMTINKSQGQSLKVVGIDLRSPVFAHGQLYVALSRCTSSSRIFVLFPQDSLDTSTINVVYEEALDPLKERRRN